VSTTRTDGLAGLGVTLAAVIAYAIAMAYVESAVVVDLQTALNSRVGPVFPLQPVDRTGGLIAIEAGREAATIVMIAAVGLLAGRTWLERLAWSAIVFGAWDIGYYGWLHVFSGWPPSLDTPDILFLLPVPWVGPVWSPMVVSVALVLVGLIATATIRAGRHLPVSRRHVTAGLAGGLLVILSWTLDAGRLLDGGLPGPYPWPVFAIGLLLALAAAGDALWRARTRGYTATPGSGSGVTSPSR
jgi:hypothetical protein